MIEVNPGDRSGRAELLEPPLRPHLSCQITPVEGISRRCPDSGAALARSQAGSRAINERTP